MLGFVRWANVKMLLQVPPHVGNSALILLALLVLLVWL